MKTWTRRQFVRAAAYGGALLPMGLRARAALDWDAGEVVHLIPAANHERLLLKGSLRRAPESPPVLLIDGRRIQAAVTDSAGEFFELDVPNLSPDTEYTLKLVSREGSALCDPWPLRTYPAPDSDPDAVRILAFTGAGGSPDSPAFVPLATRRRLLARALSFRPDALISIGDNVYWDQRTQLESARENTRAGSRRYYEAFGMLDRYEKARGTANEPILKRIASEQIIGLYGTMLRSTPSYFVNDDHDYFENDEATDRFVTLPPDFYQVEFARFVRDLVFPEFLPDAGRPLALSGSGAADRPDGVSESFGTIRWGRLFEALIYDCARFLSLKGIAGGLVPPDAEHWLLARTEDQSVRHLVHVPAHPFGWTAGKWREWYPDVADMGEDAAGDATVARMGGNPEERFRLTKNRRKFMWQSGWWAQHQRLLTALSSQTRRAAIVLSGDLHATGHGRITRSGDLELAGNPVHTILAGPLGTRLGWPSRARGTPPMPALDLTLESETGVLEKNGFALLDADREGVRIRLFQWREEEGSLADIDTLTPYYDRRLQTPGRR